MVATVEAHEVSAKTVNNARTCLSVALGEASRRGLIPRNPCAAVPPLPVDRKDLDYLRLDGSRTLAIGMQQMARIVGRGIPVLIPPDAKSRKGTRPGWDGGLYAFMRRVLASDRGGELYGQRQAIIETVFANTQFNRESTASDDEAEPRSAPSGD